MKLGERIRTARLNAGMTQTELAGDFITRNMLSQIENGLAMPSLQTALYIADKLGIDVGLLFSDSDDRSLFFLTGKLPELKKHFSEGRYDKCIELCGNEGELCDEAHLILADCYISKAYEAFNKGKLRQALKWGESAVKNSSKCIYSTDSIKLKNELLEVMVASVTPYLKQTKHRGEERRYLIERFVELLGKKQIYSRIKESRELSEEGRYSEAMDINRELLKERDLGVPFEYMLYCELEVCFRELKDYENAYKYSQNAKRLFEEMQQ